MSCGKPHDTPCSDILDKVYEYIDGELDPQGLQLIKSHLVECGPCLREYGLEEEIKRLVHRSCRNEEVPTGLRERVMVRIEQITVELRSS